jgi:Hydroxyacylglutathione hydrolase C-terminus
VVFGPLGIVRSVLLTAGQDPEVQKTTGETDPVEVMAKLREMKNNFK